MQLSQERPDSAFWFRRCGPGEVVVGDRVLTRSFLLAPERLVEDWPVREAAAFDVGAASALLELDPELVLLGTGARQVFPSHESRVVLLRRQIGIEVMDNAAVCRTWNLLAAEGRRPLAAVMLPG